MATQILESTRSQIPPVSHTGALRVAIVGCGAMTRDFHLPVLAGHDGFRVVALIDRDLPRARDLARAYSVPVVHGDSAALDTDAVDGVLVVTPPAHHAPATIDLVRRGFHVLVEKPMALTTSDAEAMVQAADEAGVVLVVGHHRRLYLATRLLHALLAEQAFGKPISFDVEEGGPYTWPLASLANLRRDLGGGGVLVDIGSHLLDELLFCLRGEAEVLDYRDNALGGIETDCTARVRLTVGGQAIEGRLELSRTRSLRGSIRIECERATLELIAGDRSRVRVRPHGGSLIDPFAAGSSPYHLDAAWDGTTEEPGRAAYRLEYEDWLSGIRTGRVPVLAGRTAVPVVRLIEQCYRQARRLEEPWVQAGLPPLADSAPAAPVRVSARVMRVLLTGATGFIGCRTAEVLHLSSDWQVRALVHNPGSAARLARLPVEMVVGQLSDPEGLARALEGCDAVVHCAVGPSWQSRGEVFAVNATGTLNLAQAARKAGVNRFVHLSTIAVYGNEVPPLVDEDTPARPDPASSYGTSKLAAERHLLEEVERGLPGVILRPAHVYGPFGKTFITNPLQHLARGALVLVAADSTPSNTIHVDNVAAGVIRALEAPEAAVKGQVFTLSAEDDLTWLEFFDFFARALDKPLRLMSLEEWQARNAPRKRDLLAWPRAWWRGGREIIGSPELRSFARRCVQTDPYGRLPRWLLERFPRLRRLAGLDAPLIYRPATTPAPGGELVMKFLPAKVSIERARRVLGFAPALSRHQALDSTLTWLRQARLLSVKAGGD